MRYCDETGLFRELAHSSVAGALVRLDVASGKLPAEDAGMVHRGYETTPVSAEDDRVGAELPDVAGVDGGGDVGDTNKAWGDLRHLHLGETVAMAHRRHTVPTGVKAAGGRTVMRLSLPVSSTTVSLRCRPGPVQEVFSVSNRLRRFRRLAWFAGFLGAAALVGACGSSEHTLTGNLQISDASQVEAELLE